MALFGLGPALASRVTAPSHRVRSHRIGETTTLAGTLLVAGCNLGHSSPTLREEVDPEPGSEPTVVPGSGDGGPGVDAGRDGGQVGCSEGAYRCVRSGASERQKCEAGRWLAASSCGRDRVCEVANATTTSCVPAPSDCDGGNCETCNLDAIACEYLEGAEDVAVSCSDGNPRRTNCRDESPHCVTGLGCKACSQTSHCTAQPPDCYEYTCNDDFTCELVARSEGSPCAGGVCDAAHACVECVDAADCGDPATCRTLTCESGQCVESLANPRSSCAQTDGGLCDQAGGCVACLDADDCSETEVPVCHRASCSEAGRCEPQPLDVGSPCGDDASYVCDGAGACVQCVDQTHCDEATVCHDAQCVSAYIDVGWFDGSTDAEATAFAGFVYLRRLEPLSHPATIRSFGAIASATTTTAIDIGVYADNGVGTWPEGEALTVQRLEGVLDTYRSVPASSHPELLAGTHYWLGFRVSSDVALRLSAEPPLTYTTGRRIQTGDFGTPFYVATEADATGGDSVETFTVFAVVQYTQ